MALTQNQSPSESPSHLPSGTPSAIQQPSVFSTQLPITSLTPTSTGFTEWRVVSETTMLRNALQWWVGRLWLYSNTECTGNVQNQGTPIDSGHTSEGEPWKAFDYSGVSYWMGTSTTDTWFIGMEFDDYIDVQCVRITDARLGATDYGTRELRVEAWNTRKEIWVNHGEVTDRTTGSSIVLIMGPQTTSPTTRYEPSAPPSSSPSGTPSTPKPTDSPLPQRSSQPSRFVWPTYEYLGCYADVADDRALPNWQGQNLSLERCAELCSGYKYFNRQLTQQCWCGNGDYAKHGETTGCVCDQSNIGSFVSCTYEVQHVPSTSPSLSLAPSSAPTDTEYYYLGCYKDYTNNNRRVLPVYKGKDKSFDQCANLCASYRYFGRQGQQECWCGDADYDRYGLQPDGCQCDTSFIGANRNCVYERKRHYCDAGGCPTDHTCIEAFGCLPSTYRRIIDDNILFVYYLSNRIETFEAHEQIARDCGGHLGSVSGVTDHKLVLDLAASTDGPSLWLGGRQPQPCNDEPTGCWGWSNGNPFYYQNWNNYEPNNANNNEHCLQLVVANEKWNDNKCDAQVPAIYLLPLDFNDRLDCSFRKALPTSKPSSAPFPITSAPSAIPTALDLNEFTNPGFEDGVAGWGPHGGCTVSAQNLITRNGFGAAMAQSRSKPYMGIQVDMTSKLEVGKGYAVSAWMKLGAGGASTDKGFLNLKITDDNGTAYARIATYTASVDVWTEIGGEFLVDVTGRLQELVIYWACTKADVDFYLDDASLVLILPSGTPSKKPTSIPSTSPSISPTMIPETNNPTKAPTSTPSTSPSISPTMIAETHNPTKAPTSTPSTSPSISPTMIAETHTPTKAPTSTPSTLPSISPTMILETHNPSKAPTSTPSTLPSILPTKIPETNTPSKTPTSAPSALPSILPSISKKDMFIKKYKSVNKKHKDVTKVKPLFKVYIFDDQKSSLKDVDIVIAWNTTMANGKVKNGTSKPSTTKGKAGIATIKLPTQKKSTVMSVRPTSISRSGYQYNKKLNKKYDRCRLFTPKCPFVTLSFQD